MSNLILNTDSYKCSQFNQYPPNTDYVYSYIESRGGEWDATLFYGLQIFLKDILSKPITQEDIDEAEYVLGIHGEPFNKEGWQYILENHNGYIPVSICAVPEGTIVPTKNVLVTVINTDPRCAWITSYIETALLRAVWYPTTVATNSLESKKIILRYLERNGDPSLIDFKLHDFGARGVSSFESAGIAGSAHLVNFRGTDTITGILYANKFYKAGVAGFSIPAMEHSTVTSWGRENEVESYRNMLKVNGKAGVPIAFVSDSYDIYNACRMWGTDLKQEVIDSGAIVVIRPDSGEPATVVKNCLLILDKYYGSTTNSKGYKVLNNVRVIQGDGIDQASIRRILALAEMEGFSADNIAFGQGGALLQQVNRDTMKFAMKCSAVGIRVSTGNREDGMLGKLELRDVYKDPATDPGKASKRGMVTLYTNGTEFVSGVIGEQPKPWTDKKWEVALQQVYRNGQILKTYTFDEVRANARIN